ncbi:isoprenylcysteine carboxylmethyltransferase family protein [uncultured Jannaschia sp.]|uniref:isoprenylcysteine carboxyl methyltransferase family protein n=1 Tax=uncultured Jannaschia sp. TaxID=293347 RepID=UPI00260DB9BB|nr:isoprenylcysteine carboxylmethyltransferase family protein [uncultured Jannaschia sp.]
MSGATAFLVFLVAQRLGELWIARRNTARLLARGAVEHGAKHYPAIVALHATWLAAMAWFGWDKPVHPGWLAAFVVLQVLRGWVLTTLGERWTTRIIVLPEPVVMHGPFRLIPHPNYAVVVAEIAVAPLVLGLFWVALVFSVLNAALLFGIRIPAESRALAPCRR